MNEFLVRKATVGDVRTIHALLMELAGEQMLLPRSFHELYKHLRDFMVAEHREMKKVVGCCALSIAWEDLAEIRSLAVSLEHRGKGLGRTLVEDCLSEAVTLGLYRIFTLTYQDGFFSRIGFQEVGKEVLPHKVWADCINCPKFPECDEVAMTIDL